MIASYFEVKKQDSDNIVFHSLSHVEDTGTIQYEKSDKFGELKNNAIITAFNTLLDEIYNLGM